jgi:hypothetical protein
MADTHSGQCQRCSALAFPALLLCVNKLTQLLAALLQLSTHSSRALRSLVNPAGSNVHHITQSSLAAHKHHLAA